MISFGNKWVWFAGNTALGVVRLFNVGIRWRDRSNHNIFWSEMNGKRYTLCNGNQVMTSTDGFNWTERANKAGISIGNYSFKMFRPVASLPLSPSISK